MYLSWTLPVPSTGQKTQAVAISDLCQPGPLTRLCLGYLGVVNWYWKFFSILFIFTILREVWAYRWDLLKQNSGLCALTKCLGECKRIVWSVETVTLSTMGWNLEKLFSSYSDPNANCWLSDLVALLGLGTISEGGIISMSPDVLLQVWGWRSSG